MAESEGENSIVQNRSKLKDFLASIATIRGDLSNITAPPFVLSPQSVVELPSFWAEHPAIFTAPGNPDVKDPAQRALLVLKWFVSSLRGQQYMGRDPEQGVKKPLNAFLGELFLARWEGDNAEGSDGVGVTRLVSEQVSHHPPVTACRVWNEKQGVYAEGFTRQEITFTGNVNIKQTGYATLRLSHHDNETYLIPLPSVKVKGILSGTPYPELNGTYHIPSTNGYMSTIDFSGKSFFSLSDEKKHFFEAKLHLEGKEDEPLYTVSGNWDSEFVIHDVNADKDIETFNVATAKSTPLQTDSLDEQDPWETRAAWRGVREALDRGDMQGTSDAKNIVEQGQRDMRKDEERDNKEWERVFYRPEKSDKVAEQLAEKIGQKINPEDTVAIWKFSEDRYEKLKKPFHGGLRPDNKRVEEEGNVGMKKEEKQTRTTAGEDDAVLSDESRDRALPIMSLEEQHKEVVETRQLESGMEGMTVNEKTAVEDMLRDRYASAGQ